ncbi:hypothetical protein NG799_19080 [Laspinema sp. D1]|uniref:CRISPR type III-B/RAMP module-associated protein Cmr5 n=1 Tax=Laspinema palackyanum D2a TaxID=2953684 RepID=A0ABT2MWZ8_9CYAN|nr:hypothetical protein [Laspinema sp. D2a]
MALHAYNLDRIAQQIVLKYRDQKVLNESHKMRQTAVFGLERFWGEHLRLLAKPETRDAGQYWRDTWKELANIMAKAGIAVPNDSVEPNNTGQIREMAEKLWNDEEFSRDDRQFTLAVLIQLCDSLVWWTQRYKKKAERDAEVTTNES